jgi:hypothetical protein
MESYRTERARAMPVVPTPAIHPDPPDVQAFRELATARRWGDRSQLRRLIAELLGYGWAVYACEPRQAGKAVTR